MIQIEFVEERILLDGVEYYAGDVKTLEDGLAQTCIDNGWARDKASGEIGERVPGARGIVQPANIQQKSA